MDYRTVRALTDASDTLASRVEVNQRALIDKILARYATASAVYRELLQNSNDASAQVTCVFLLTAVVVDLPHHHHHQQQTQQHTHAVFLSIINK
jgi:hypothetical protein